jgi:hypothetical protein
MTRTAEIAYVAAVVAMGSVIWAVWHDRPVSAIAFAINGVTLAILALVANQDRRRP